MGGLEPVDRQSTHSVRAVFHHLLHEVPGLGSPFMRLQADNLTKNTTFTVQHRLSPRQVNDVLAGGLIPQLAQEGN